MNKKKYTKILLFFVLFFPFAKILGYDNFDLNSFCYKDIGRISAEVSQELQQRYHLKQSGSGLLFIAFAVPRSLSQEEARYLLVTALDLYLDKLNKDPLLQEHCPNYPFKLEHIKVSLDLSDPYRGKSFSPNPSIASNFEESLNYYFKKADDDYHDEKISEQYTEAKKILSQVKADDTLLKVNEPFKKAATKTLYDFARKVKKTKKLVVTGTGIDKDQLAIQFTIFRPLSVSEARKLILETTDELLSAINLSKELAPYLTHYPFNRGDIEVVICSKTRGEIGTGSMWPDAPHPTLVALRNDELVYEFRDPSLTRHRIEESYVTALKLVKGKVDHDEVALFADDVTRRNLENSVENRIRRQRQKS